MRLYKDWRGDRERTSLGWLSISDPHLGSRILLLRVAAVAVLANPHRHLAFESAHGHHLLSSRRQPIFPRLALGSKPLGHRPIGKAPLGLSWGPLGLLLEPYWEPQNGPQYGALLGRLSPPPPPPPPPRGGGGWGPPPPPPRGRPLGPLPPPPPPPMPWG